MVGKLSRQHSYTLHKVSHFLSSFCCGYRTKLVLPNHLQANRTDSTLIEEAALTYYYRSRFSEQTEFESG